MILAGAIALLALLSSCSKPEVKEFFPEQLTLTSLDGTQTSIQQFRGKLLILNVWATWCPPCRKEMPSLERLSKNAASQHFIVAGLAVDDSVNAVREFVALHHVTFPIFTDTPSTANKVLGVQIYPTTLLISPDGKIVQKIIGDRDWNSPEMIKMLEEAYQGKRSP